jgi:predicted DNA-binding protein
MPTLKPLPPPVFAIPLGVRVTEDIKRRMDALKRTRGIPIAFQVHAALEAYLAQEERRAGQ